MQVTKIKYSELKRSLKRLIDKSDSSQRDLKKAAIGLISNTTIKRLQIVDVNWRSTGFLKVGGREDLRYLKSVCTFLFVRVEQ